jgi:HEAT repeat protein
MQTSRGSETAPLHVVARVRTLMRQVVTLLKNAATYETSNTAFERSIDMLYTGLKAFLEEHESLPLRIRKKEIAYFDQVVYVPIGRSDALIHPLYRDGIRRLTFSKDLTREELTAFAKTLAGARETDPYESDLVTALWERDFANIRYEADDVYLECDEGGGIEGLAEKIRAMAEEPAPLPGTRPAGFLLRELGLAEAAKPCDQDEADVTEEEIDRVRSMVLDEDDALILERASAICLEILESSEREEVFRSTARFIGEICDWLISVQDFMPVCAIISDLRAIGQRSGAPDWVQQAVASTVSKRGESEKVLEIEAYAEELSDARMEELFCYLAQMDETAIEPLCQMLARAETRRVRYMLARVISIIAKDSPERLESYLKDSRWYVARNIAMILGMIATEKTLPLLKQVLRHEEPRVRREVARALGRIKRPEGLVPLRALVYDDNKMIRLAAVSAAGVIGGDPGLAFLKEVIEDPRFETMATDEKRRVMEVYGALGQGSVDFLQELIDGGNGDVSERTRACAVYGLATSGSGDARKKLKKLLTAGEGALKYAASEAISMFDGRVDVSGSDEA